VIQVHTEHTEHAKRLGVRQTSGAFQLPIGIRLKIISPRNAVDLESVDGLYKCGRCVPFKPSCQTRLRSSKSKRWRATAVQDA